MKKPAPLMHLMIAVMTAAFIGLFASSASAGDAGAPSWMPAPAKATGGECDADPLEMRKWHMKKLNHKRDKTMHEGIRTKKFSLKRCITCHAVKGDDGKFVTIKDERHFCRTCHDYAAVKMDCFGCHASRPGEATTSAAAKAKGNPHAAAGTPEDALSTLARLQKQIAGGAK